MAKEETKEPYKVGNKKPPREYCIKKGEVKNPLGARAHNPEIRKLKTLTNKEVAEVGTLLLNNDLLAVKKVATDKGVSVLKSWIAKVAIKAHAKGDMHTLDKLLDRVAGKVQQKVELTGGEGGPIKTETVTMSKAERDAEIERLDSIADEIGND